MIDRAFARVPVVRAKLAILATLLVTAWLTWRLSDVQIRQSANLSRLALSQHSETVDAFFAGGEYWMQRLSASGSSRKRSASASHER